MRVIQKKCFYCIQGLFPGPPEARARILSIGCTGLCTPLHVQYCIRLCIFSISKDYATICRAYFTISQNAFPQAPFRYFEVFRRKPHTSTYLPLPSTYLRTYGAGWKSDRVHLFACLALLDFPRFSPIFADFRRELSPALFPLSFLLLFRPVNCHSIRNFA